MSSESNRDRSSMERLLKSATVDALAPASAACVDAETLAAWSEHTLSTSDAARVETHLADCARCQAMLAVFVQAEPAVAAAAVPFWQRWQVRWLAPLAAAAAALLMWAVVPRDDQSPTQVTTMARVEPAETAIAPPPPAPTASNRNDQGSASNGDVRQAPSAKSEPNAAPRAENTGERSRETARAQSAAETTPPPVEFAKPPAPAVVAAPPPPPPNAPSPEAPRLAMPTAPPTTVVPGPSAAAGGRIGRNSTTNSAAKAAESNPGTTRPSAADAVAGAGEAAVPTVLIEVTPPAAEAMLGLPPAAQPPPPPALAPRRTGRASPAVVAPPPPPPPPPTRWRIVANTRVDRWTANGTWEAALLSAPVRLNGGFAPSFLVCWLVGPRGVVMRATDGVHFERVPFPETTDLSSVIASDGLRAKVTAADGRVFGTIDGGRNWTSMP